MTSILFKKYWTIIKLYALTNPVQGPYRRILAHAKIVAVWAKCSDVGIEINNGGTIFSSTAQAS